MGKRKKRNLFENKTVAVNTGFLLFSPNTCGDTVSDKHSGVSVNRGILGGAYLSTIMTVCVCMLEVSCDTDGSCCLSVTAFVTRIFKWVNISSVTG